VGRWRRGVDMFIVSEPWGRLFIEHPLARAWAEELPGVCPLGGLALPEHRWVRFHSLPGSRRYPRRGLTGRRDWRELLNRHTALIEELCALAPAGFLSRPKWPQNDLAFPGNARWRSTGLSWLPWAEVDTCDALEGPPLIFMAAPITWPAQWADRWLRAVAKYEVSGALIAADLSWIAAPYDGGIDLMLPTTELRDAFQERHAAWRPVRGNL
jgi:hypothetical protein